MTLLAPSVSVKYDYGVFNSTDWLDYLKPNTLISKVWSELKTNRIKAKAKQMSHQPETNGENMLINGQTGKFTTV